MIQKLFLFFVFVNLPLPTFYAFTNIIGKKKLPSWILTSNETKYRFLDYFTKSDLYFTCTLGKNAKFRYESYSDPVVRKTVKSSNDRISITGNYNRSTLRITSLTTKDSGSYGCVLENRISPIVLKVVVHNPADFVWTFSGRGQAPARFIEMGHSTVDMKWTEWYPCDGCAGAGERKRFGFCYVTAESGFETQCADLRNLSFVIRPFAKNMRNHMQVETCFEECRDDGIFTRPLTKLRFFVRTGDNVVLTCPGNITMRTPVRWERQYDTLLRKDVSFGYAPAKPYYIGKENELRIHNVQFHNMKEIVITCVLRRQTRFTFELVHLHEEDDGVTEMIDHLKLMAVSCTLQFVVFLIIVVIVNAAKTFSESVSKGL